MNNPTFISFCEFGIGRADIEESKSSVDMNSELPQASSFIPEPLPTAAIGEGGKRGSVAFPLTAVPVSPATQSALGTYCGVLTADPSLLGE